jgi:hypothetical protein
MDAELTIYNTYRELFGLKSVSKWFGSSSESFCDSIARSPLRDPSATLFLLMAFLRPN